MSTTKFYGIITPLYREYFLDENARENFLSSYFKDSYFERVTLQYIGEYNNRFDVFAIINEKHEASIYSIASNVEYEIISDDKRTWKREYGNLRTEYNTFKKHGIEFIHNYYDNAFTRNR